MTPTYASEFVVLRSPFLQGGENVTGAQGHPAQGQFVITGPQMGGTDESRIGFCVQVRKGVGAYGSHTVFLRHPQGNLTPHENQAFYALTPEQEAAARALFVTLPEHEDYSGGYTIQGDFPEIGFLIENPEKAQAISGAGRHLRVEKTNPDGSKSKTFIVFI